MPIEKCVKTFSLLVSTQQSTIWVIRAGRLHASHRFAPFLPVSTRKGSCHWGFKERGFKPHYTRQLVHFVWFPPTFSWPMSIDQNSMARNYSTDLSAKPGAIQDRLMKHFKYLFRSRIPFLSGVNRSNSENTLTLKIIQYNQFHII